MQILYEDLSNGAVMEWLVIDVIYLKTVGCIARILHAGALEIMAEVIVEAPLYPGDVLNPVTDVLYLINQNENQRLKVIRVSTYSAIQWRFLKRISGCQTTITKG